jgi:hypothetical protein
MDLLMFLIVLLLVFWLLGAFAFPIVGVGNLVHVLLILIVVLIIFKLVQGRNVV